MDLQRKRVVEKQLEKEEEKLEVLPQVVVERLFFFHKYAFIFHFFQGILLL
jgi:hypothetical protein